MYKIVFKLLKCRQPLFYWVFAFFRLSHGPLRATARRQNLVCDWIHDTIRPIASSHRSENNEPISAKVQFCFVWIYSHPRRCLVAVLRLTQFCTPSGTHESKYINAHCLRINYKCGHKSYLPWRGNSWKKMWNKQNTQLKRTSCRVQKLAAVIKLHSRFFKSYLWSTLLLSIHVL